LKKAKPSGPVIVGEVRLEIDFTALKSKKEREVKGILAEANLNIGNLVNLLQGKWTPETNGGTLMQHGTWMKNPQFLLKVKKQTEINIKLFQPENCEERISFYLLKYEEFWNGLPKLVFFTEDLIKIDNFWAAVLAVEGFVTQQQL
jgi:hypothetical protein